MPRLGTSIRITSAVVAAALIAVVVAGAASAQRSRAETRSPAQAALSWRLSSFNGRLLSAMR